MPEQIYRVSEGSEGQAGLVCIGVAPSLINSPISDGPYNRQNIVVAHYGTAPRGASTETSTVYCDRLYAWRPETREQLQELFGGELGWGTSMADAFIDPEVCRKFNEIVFQRQCSYVQVIEFTYANSGYPVWCFVGVH